MEHFDKILDLSEKDKVVGIIYKIINTKTNKLYVGQTRSHRKNKKKYRPFGHIGRLNDHFSEAENNTTNSQSLCLNNSIRKHGKAAFTCEIIELCSLESLDDKETFYIKKLNALYPNGYNIREGNHMFSAGKIKNNAEQNEPRKKRGRDFGYKHKEETKDKMKKYYENVDEKIMEKKKETMSSTISDHFANKRAETLANSDIKLDDNFKDLIRPYKKNGVLSGYSIRYNRKRYSQIVCNDKYTTEDIYKMYYEALEEAYKIRKQAKTQ